MKLSAVLAISVPIAAASQLPAVAADPPPVGGANWLQNSISELSPAKAKMSTTSYAVAQKQIPVSARVAHASPESPLKLRPFRPGRYLPSERELRAAMQPQQAQYDPSVDQQQQAYAQGGMLNGQVSSQYSTQRTRSAYDQYAMNPSQLAAVAMPIAQRVKAEVKRAIGQRAPRVVPNQPTMVPEQITQQVPMVQAQIPEPPVQQRQMRSPFPVSMPVNNYQQSAMAQQQQMMMQQFQMQQQMQMQQQQMPQQQMQMQMQQQMQMPQQQAMQNYAPADISPAEANAMFRQVVANPPQAKLGINGELTGQALDNPGNGTGQPPFPLNFLGGNAMGQLSQSQYRPQNVPQARFGSWHGGNGLASAGFHSYVQRRQPMMYEYSRAPMPVARKSSSKHAHAHAHSAPPTVAHAKSSAGPKAPVKVASYPAYTSYRSAY